MGPAVLSGLFHPARAKAARADAHGLDGAIDFDSGAVDVGILLVFRKIMGVAHEITELWPFSAGLAMTGLL